MKLSLGFSPCPNDTFIFDAMIHQKIDTEGLEFEVVMDDVEALNQLAFDNKLDITKLSYHAYAYLVESYILLNAGSALGKNCGPLLIANEIIDKEQISSIKIAIPGKYTTANFLLSLAFPEATNKEEFLFSAIENAVLSDEVAAGLIIHENRFTYESKGLKKIIDLGEFWEETTALPIPLGGIVLKRSIDPDIQLKVDRVLKRSVDYALKNPNQTLDFVSEFAQEMNKDIMMKHIHLYVNEFTQNLGVIGRSAVAKMFKMAEDKKLIQLPKLPLFVADPANN